MNEINVQSVESWIILILLNKQSYKQLGLIDIYKEYTMIEINVQSVMRCWRLNNLILLNKQCHEQINLIDIQKQYTMNEFNDKSLIRYWKGKKIE